MDFPARKFWHLIQSLKNIDNTEPICEADSTHGPPFGNPSITASDDLKQRNSFRLSQCQEGKLGTGSV